MFDTASTIESDAMRDMGASGAAPVRFDALELRVLKLVAGGHERGPRAAKLGHLLFGERGGAPLADSRLEALRRQAAALLAGGREACADFLAAGYSLAQFDAVARMMRAARPDVRSARFQHATGIALGFASILGFVGLTAAMFTQV